MLNFRCMMMCNRRSVGPIVKVADCRAAVGRLELGWAETLLEEFAEPWTVPLIHAELVHVLVRSKAVLNCYAHGQ